MEGIGSLLVTGGPGLSSQQNPVNFDIPLDLHTTRNDRLVLGSLTKHSTFLVEEIALKPLVLTV